MMLPPLRRAAWLAISLPLLLQSALAETPTQGERTAGSATVWATGRNAFSFPLANLTDEERAALTTAPRVLCKEERPWPRSH